MSDERQRWIDAARQLAADASARVDCPACRAATLTIIDAPIPGVPPRVERHLRCPACGAYNALLMHAR